MGSTKRPASPRCTEAQHITLHIPIGKAYLSLPRVGIPVVLLSGSPLLCSVRRPTPIVNRDPALPTVTAGESPHPIKKQ
jgi:hypothetical protein